MDTKKTNTYIQGIRRNKMPRAKKQKPTRKVTRKISRRKVDRRKKSSPIDAFWTRVINGMKKLLSPAFPKK